MAGATYLQSSFLGGEWSLHMQGRYDRPDYRTALTVCLNGFPTEEGAWHRRPGTMYGGHTRNGAQGRVYTFDFKQATPYTMEFTDGVLRFRVGAVIAKTNDATSVVAISAANPAVVQLSGAVTWSTGDQGMFSGLGTQCPLLQNRQLKLTKIDTTHFSLQDALTSANIDGSTLGTYTSGATLSRILEVATIYSAGSWANVRSVQAETQAVLMNGTSIPQVLTATPPSGNNFATFTIQNADFRDGPYLDPVMGGVQISPGSLNGAVPLCILAPLWSSTKAYAKGDFARLAGTGEGTTYQSLVDTNLANNPAISPSQWTAVSAGIAVGTNGFVSTDVGRVVRLFSEPQTWVAQAWSVGSIVTYQKTYYKSTGGVDANTAAPPLQPNVWSVFPGAQIWTWGKIVAVISRITPSGTNIGDLSGGGGLAAAFDQTLPEVQAQTPTGSIPDNGLKASSAGAAKVSTTTGYVGNNFTGSAKAIIGATIFPSNDKFFCGFASNLGNVTINLRGKASVPANAADGTLLGTSGLIADQNTGLTILSNDTSTQWNYLWFEVLPASSANVFVSQVEFYQTASSGANRVIVQLRGDPLRYVYPVTTWRLGLYNDRDGWPTSGVYHEGRLLLSGAVGNRLDASRSNSLSVINGAAITFSPTETDGTVSDSCGFSYIFNARDVNSILWMLSDDRGVICGTQAGEWLVSATTQNAILTPTSIQAHRVTRIGCANIEPRQTGLSYVFVQRYTRKLMEYFSDVFSGRLTSPNLSLKAKHLMTSGIAELAYQQELSPIIWARMGDGSLKGVSYKRENLLAREEPTFAGWHRHVLGSGRIVESMAGGPSSDGTLDALTLVTNDTGTNVRHVEVLTNLFDEGANISTSWFLDDAVAPSSTVIGAIVSGNTGVTMNGLWHLNGKTVSATCGGLDVGDYTVSNGSIFVPYGAGGGLFTAAFIAGFSGSMPVVVGFTYTSQGQIVRPNSPQESGARNGPAFGKLRRAHQALLQVVGTQGIKFGTDFGKLRTPQFASPGGNVYTSLQLFSGIYRDAVDDIDSFDSMLCWQLTRPYPATVVAVGGFIETKDA